MKSKYSSGKQNASSFLLVRLLPILAVVAFADFVFGSVFIGLLLDRGIGPSEIGLLLLLSGAFNTLLEAPSGALGDRFGQRKMLILGLVLWGISLLLFGLLSQPLAMVVIFSLWGTGLACYAGAPYALIVNTLKSRGEEEHVGRVVRATQVTRWLFSALGALTVYFAGESMTDSVLAVCGLVMILCALPVRFLCPETDPTRLAVSSILGIGIRSFYRSSPLQWVAGYSVLSSLLFAVVVVCWQPLLLDSGWGIESLGLAMFSFTFCSAIGSYLARFTESHPIFWINVTIFASLLFLAGAVFGGGEVAFLSVSQGIMGATLASIAVWSHSVYDDDVRNTQASLVSAAGGLAIALVDLLFGLTWNYLGITKSILAWVFALNLVLLGFILIRSVAKFPWKRRSKGDPVQVMKP